MNILKPNFPLNTETINNSNPYHIIKNASQFY